MLEDQPSRSCPQGPRSLKEFALLEGHKLPAHQSCHAHPGHEPNEGDDDPDGLIAPQGNHRNDQNEGRKGEHHVHKAHDHAVHPTAVVSSHRSDGGPQGHRQAHGQEAHQQGNPRAINDPAEHVASKPIGPQQVFSGRGKQSLLHPVSLFDRIIGCEKGAKKGNQIECQNDEGPCHSQPVL